MKPAMQFYKTWLLVPMLLVAGVSSASAAVVSLDSFTTISEGSTTPAPAGATAGQVVEYFIPLRGNDSSDTYVGTYGDTGTTPSPFCSGGVGTCSDSGDGFGYLAASALTMNLYFDLSTISESATAELDIWFRDLDLDPINDPPGFFESISVSYWDVGNPGVSGDEAIVALGPVVTQASQLLGDFAGASVDPGLPAVPSSTYDPFTWTLDLAALGILGDLEDSRQQTNGFWIQLGFGSNFCKSGEDPGAGDLACTKHGSNTSEKLLATLNVSPVPLPSAVWLFGSALLGFIGVSRRTRV